MDILLNNEMFVTITGLILFFTLSIIINFIDNIYKKITKKPTKSHTTLNCGIWGWAGKDSKDFNKSKFDILGLYNDSRGGQGCGIYKNGEIIKSSKEKLYKDFLVNLNYNNDLENPVIFGHARKSSSGTVNDNNTHPFGFGELKNGEYEFAGAHNGTLYNERELATMFESDYSKIDSHILLESIYKSENFKVLSHYIGAAAIVFVNNKEPNTIYAFRGQSAKYESSKKIEDERPLYFFQETKNSLYISSMMESLVAITEHEDDIENIEEFEANKVYKIVNGNLDSSTKTSISRKNCFQREYNYYNHSSAWNRPYSKRENKSNTTSNKNKDKNKKIDLNSKIKDDKTKNNKKSESFDITKESLPRTKGNGDKVKFEKFKYCRNGHPVTGIYLYTINDELIRLDEDYVDAVQEFHNKYVNHYFDLETGEFKKAKAELKDINSYYIPYRQSDINNLKELPLIYIVKGHRVMTRRDYEASYNRKDIDSYQLQFCSFYPVIQKKLAYLKGEKIIHERFKPLGSKFIYTIVNGNVVSRKNQNMIGILKSINSTFDCKEADIKYLKNFSKIFEGEVSILKKNDNLKVNKKYNGLFGQYLEDLEEDEGPSIETIFNLPAEDVEIYEEAEEINSHLIEEINDEEYVTKEEKQMINYICNRLINVSEKYLSKKVDVLTHIKNNKAKKLIEITETFINSVKEFSENETDNILKRNL